MYIVLVFCAILMVFMLDKLLFFQLKFGDRVLVYLHLCLDTLLCFRCLYLAILALVLFNFILFNVGHYCSCKKYSSYVPWLYILVFNVMLLMFNFSGLFIQHPYSCRQCPTALRSRQNQWRGSQTHIHTVRRECVVFPRCESRVEGKNTV